MDVANDLASWLGRRVVPCTEIKEFYNKFPFHKPVIQSVRLSTFLNDNSAFFSTKLFAGTRFMFTMQLDSLIEKFGVKMDSIDPVLQLSKDLQLFRNDQGRVPLGAIEAALEPIRDDVGSMNKFSKLMREAGMSLSTGEVYGNALRTALQENDGERKVPLKKVKEFLLVKKCLITCA
tara:strand:- start:207 stop:737 length:531 start_codon:yes stop_codon:yes gene_type:complete